jgi:hypothetical protein
VTVGSGNVIIDMVSTGGCVLVPTPWGERVPIGRIPAGTHTMIVKYNGVEIGRQTLVVRDQPFLIRPSFGNAGTIVWIGQRDHGPCAIFPCAPPVVTFGGSRAEVTVTEDGDISAVAPNHEPGLVDIVVTDRDGKSVTAPQAFLYPAPQADLTSEHERVLYPVQYNGPGAHGSDWRTANVILNRGPIALSTIPTFAPPIAPEQRIVLDTPNSDGGLLYMVPRGTEPWFAYSSHITDRSRRATDAGTELQVVHEKDAGPELNILNVPLTTESRQTLRIYDLDAIDGREVTVVVRIPGRTEPIQVGATLTHRIVCVTTPCYPHHPTYAVVNLDTVPQLRGVGLVDITIYPRTNEALLWAFVSVTNNDTQHVTTYSPQHRRMTVP